MFVLNIKMDLKKIILMCIVIATIVAAIVEFGTTDNFVTTSKNIDKYDYELNNDNFIDITKNIHENLDKNIGKTIKISGFVYTLPDFKEDFFVCGRYINIDNETQVAGILCQNNNKCSLVENEWVEVCGQLIKGDYNGECPVIKINTVTKIPAPANTYITNDKSKES